MANVMRATTVRPAADASTAVIVKDLTKRFTAPGGEGGFVVMDSINLTVNEGQFVSIVGPSGCGKSTLLNIIAGIETCEEGSVTTVSPRTGRARSEPRVAYVFQSPRLLNWLTVADNIRTLKDVGDARLRPGPSRPWRNRGDRAFLACFDAGDDVEQR